MLRENIKQNNIQCLIKTREGRKKEVKILKRNKCNEYKTVKNMVDINQTITTIRLEVNSLSIPVENIDGQSGKLNKTQLYIIYKKLTFNIDMG